MASTTHGGGFARAAETEPGYKRSEVDRLFTRLAEDYEKLSGAAELPEDLYTSRRIRQVVFREEPGGYQLDVVDRALEKIEERFAKLERSRYIGVRPGQLGTLPRRDRRAARRPPGTPRR